MSSVDLQQAIVDGAIRSSNFFNGRLLSARDLNREQSAMRESDRRVGQAIGHGVASGLEASVSATTTKENPVVTVQSGLAVNRRGETLQVVNRTDINLIRQASGSSPGTQQFTTCVPLQSGTFLSGAGVYLLTIAPAQSTEGRAAVSGLDATTAPCNTDTIITAIQFRLIDVTSSIQLGDEQRLRNTVAYRFFGETDSADFLAAPFAPDKQTYGVLDEILGPSLTECEVPLAIIYWTTDGIRFVDRWSARRRVAHPSSDDRWPLFVSDQAMAVAEARLLQFQEQIDDLRAAGSDLSKIRARDLFNYLPPTGTIPLSGVANGFDLVQFFDGLTVRGPLFMDSAQAESLLRNSFTCSAIDLNSHEVIWLYRVRENAQRIDAGGSQIQPFAIFANGHLPPQGSARFNLARWNYSNYAIL